MDYKQYRTMGAGLIGSGAIETAYRSNAKTNEAIRTTMDKEKSTEYVNTSMYQVQW